MKRVTYLGHEGHVSAAITIGDEKYPLDVPQEVSNEAADAARAQEESGHKFKIESADDGDSSTKSAGAKKSSGGASKVSD
jgi:hypothetical protein